MDHPPCVDSLQKSEAILNNFACLSSIGAKHTHDVHIQHFNILSKSSMYYIHLYCYNLLKIKDFYQYKTYSKDEIIDIENSTQIKKSI